MGNLVSRLLLCRSFSAEEEPGYEASQWPLDVHVKHKDMHHSFAPANYV